jgi:hypothetical protein
LFVSQQPTVPDLFRAIREGADGQPPLYDLIVRGLRPVIVTDSLRVRLPSTIGFLLMGVCVSIFVRKRLPAVYAMLAALVAVRLAWSYSFEGRAYGIVLSCVGISWRESAEAKTSRRNCAWRTTGVSVAGAIQAIRGLPALRTEKAAVVTCPTCYPRSS